MNDHVAALGTNPVPWGGECLSKNIVYMATVTQEDQTKNFYTGQTSSNFKARLAVHKQTFKDQRISQTSLSRFIWNLKSKNKKYEISWKILDRGQPFSPVTEKCGLCAKEKFHILFNPKSADINKREEAFSSCMHRAPKLLIKRERKKKAPG